MSNVPFECKKEQIAIPQAVEIRSIKGNELIQKIMPTFEILAHVDYMIQNPFKVIATTKASV